MHAKDLFFVIPTYRLRGVDSTVTAQQNIYRLAVLVDGSVKIVPLALIEMYVSRTAHLTGCP
jgi:hypothetical protein